MKPFPYTTSASRLDMLETAGPRLGAMERRIERHELRLGARHRASVLECGDAAERSRRFRTLADNQGDADSGLVAHPKAVTSQAPSPHSKTSRRSGRLLPWLAALLGLFVASFVASGAQFEPPIVIESPEPEREGYFGASVASVPDVNGDGRPDFLVGGGYSGAGRVYLYDGVSRELLRELRSPNGQGMGGIGIGDVNGDGRGDVVVTANEVENRVYVLDGTTGDVIHTLEPTGARRDIVGVRGVSAVPDVNGDGRPDVAIGVVKFDSNSGVVKVYDGASGAEVRALSGTGFFGESVSGIPDVNGDGRGDVIVGAWLANRAYIYDGATGALLRTLTGSGQFGRSVVGLGDVNGDGRGDVAVGANESRRAYIHDGATGTRLHTLSAPGNPANFGWFLNRLPDVNGDGRDDVVVVPGHIRHIPGNAYVFSGVTGELLATLPSSSSVASLPDVNGDGLAEVLVANIFAKSTGGVYEAGQVLLYLSKLIPKPPEPAALGWTPEGFKLQLTGEVGLKFELQSSEDLMNWRTMVNQTQANQTTEFLDTDARNVNRRFYRTRTVP